MVAFTQPPENSNRPAELRYARPVLAELLPPVESEEAYVGPPLVGWKAWLLVTWMAIAAIGGVCHVVGTLL